MRRRDSGITLVLVRCVVAGVAVMVFLSTDLLEGRHIARLVGAIHAEALAGSVVAHLASLVDQRPRENRVRLAAGGETFPYL